MRAESAARCRACTAPGTATSPAASERTTSAVLTSLRGPSGGPDALSVPRPPQAASPRVTTARIATSRSGLISDLPSGAPQRRVRDGHLRGGPDLLELGAQGGRLRLQLVGERRHPGLSALLNHAEG